MSGADVIKRYRRERRRLLRETAAPAAFAPQQRLCRVCFRAACYGEGVNLLRGQEGTWYCAEHVPEGFLP